MAPTLLCTFLLAFLAILPTVSMAAPPSTVENDFLKRLDHSLRLDYDSWLATQFPQVPPAERRNIGVIPSNIKRLVQGAETDGRLSLVVPPRSHAFLLTKDVSSATGKVRAVGVVTDANGRVHYFSSTPFKTTWTDARYFTPSQAQETIYDPVMDQTTIIPRGASGKLFHMRLLTLNLPAGEYRTKETFRLPHISVRPLGQVVNPDETRIYPPEILNQVLNPRFEQKDGLVEWSDRPNWYTEERAALREKGKEKVAKKGTLLDWSRWTMPKLPKGSSSHEYRPMDSQGLNSE